MSALELEVSEHVRDLLKHYYDFELMSEEEVNREVERLSKTWPCLKWINEDYRILSIRETGEGLYVLLEIDDTGFVLFLPRTPRRYNPYEVRVKLETIAFSDEDIKYSDALVQHGYDFEDDFDPEEHDRMIDEELGEWRKYREVIEVGDLKITKRGVVREEWCPVNIPHYHYFKDLKYVMETSFMKLWALLRIAPLITYFA